MKKLFYSAVILLVVFEIANVYFIMPMPGSQEQNTIDLAYFLYSKRWIIRGLLFILLLVGVKSAWKGAWWLTLLCLIIPGVVAYMTHFKMAADTMFYQPKELQLVPASQSKISLDRIVLGVEMNGEAKAYPIQFLGYHHQVRDTIGGKPVMITYCTVCRSGRVFEPSVNGQEEIFRLVGMDHYNAIFEDRTTKSWWRQATGEAVAGPLKGTILPELPNVQASLETWLSLHPNSLIMQPDSNFKQAYEDMSDFESGRPEGRLTRYDTASWQDKSWIAGIDLGTISRAYDWNELVRKGVIQDMLGDIPVAIVVSKDKSSLFAFQRHTPAQELTFRRDTLTDGEMDYYLSGLPLDTLGRELKLVPVYQEYWHSWRTFHPETTRYPE
ncbi:MAG TPA: DUF3179 domain-containing (seleno)protein [Saprospiraceae bacterium]